MYKFFICKFGVVRVWIDHDKKVFIICDLFVHKKHRRKGIGHKLMAKAVKFVKKKLENNQGYRAYLYVAPFGKGKLSEDILIKFYKKHNFVTTKNTKNDKIMYYNTRKK